MGEVLLRQGRWRATVLPDLGGALMRCDVERDGRWLPLLRPAPADAADVLSAACFPTVPFFGRLRDGRFVFRGREVALHGIAPLHGCVWRMPWRVGTQAPGRVVIHCEHAAGDWPWPFVATQEIALGDAGLAITLSVRNTGDAAMPCGQGLHPYFPCDASTELSANVSARVPLDSDVLPIRGAAPVAARLQRCRVHRQGLDDGFVGWDGVAIVTQPAQDVRIRLAADASRLHVYAPADGDFVCVEAISHAIDGFNLDEADHAGAGIAVLAPGESARMRMQLSVAGPAART